MKNDLQIVLNHMHEAPADFSNVCADLEIAFVHCSLPNGESSRIERFDRDFRITVSTRLPLQQQRFAAAHEIAHYLMHRDLMDHKSRSSRHHDHLFAADLEHDPSPFTRDHELQANRLAINILMPVNVIREMTAKGATREDIATALQVSDEAMRIRMRTLANLAERS